MTMTTGGEVVTGTFTVTAGTPQITLLNPSSGNEGATLSVAVAGLYTHFGPTSVATFSGTGITVNSTTASDATDAVLNITIAANASLGPRNVTITTGTEVASINGWIHRSVRRRDNYYESHNRNARSVVHVDGYWVVHTLRSGNYND